MQIGADRAAQGLSERLAGGPEGDATERRAVAAAQGDADMAGAADFAGIDQAMVREGEDRLGLPGAERSRPLDRRDDLGPRAAGGERCVDGEGVEPLRVADGVGQALADEGREAVELGRRQR